MNSAVGYAVLSLLMVHCSSKKTDNEAPAPKFEKISINAGTNVTLSCHQKHYNHHNKNLTWEFLHCDYITDVECDDFSVTDASSINYKTEIWKNVHNVMKLPLTNATESNTGIYRCIYKNLIKKIFTVKVINNNDTNLKVKVVSILVTNFTREEKINFVLRCNVTGGIGVNIFWFKRCHPPGDYFVDDYHYCRITQNISFFNKSTIFLSKLHIYNATAVDSGVYACAAINDRNKDYMLVTITIPNEETLYLLYLIPIALVLPLLLVRLYYYRRRKVKNSEEAYEKETQPMQVLNGAKRESNGSKIVTNYL